MNWFVGTYSKRGSKGIYLLEFDESKGKIDIINSFEQQSLLNPSFLAIKNNNLYSVGESQSPNPGSVASYIISDNKIEKINELPTNGDNPCHLAINSKNNFLVVVNYSSGDFSTYSVSDGSMEFLEKISHEGSSINSSRQNEPHAHSVNFINDYTFYVCDLGIDKIIKYSVDPESKKIITSEKFSVNPGAGPRHFIINNSKEFAYSINELDSTISVFNIDNQNNLDILQNISTIPADFEEETTTADLHFSIDEKFLYGSNRGHDSLALFSINNDGTLSFKQTFSTLGKTPRNFAISKSGKYLLVANENSDNISSFYIGYEDGKLEYTGETINIPSPVCLLEIIK